MNRRTIFRVLILLFLSIGGQMSANTQTTAPFETVFDACKKACEALDSGFASGEQLLAVSRTPHDAASVPLIVKQTQDDVLSLKGHLAFDYEFTQTYVDNETVYEIADGHVVEARMGGDKDSANKVRLDTRMVAAGQACTFEIPSCSGTSQIGCVAEVNRSFNWKVKTIGYRSKNGREYRYSGNVRGDLPFHKEKVGSDE